MCYCWVDNINFWHRREGWRIMNPTQSESIWKRINQEEQAKFRIPDDDVVNNSLQLIISRPFQSGKTARKYSRGKHSLSFPQELQKQSTMKQVRAIFQWDQQFEEKLFQLHYQLGNKWSSITPLLKGPKNLKENDVKNKVYSSMRRGFRKVNKFIANVLRKRNAGGSASHKLLKEEFIVKLNAVADACYEDRFEVKQSALSLARELRKKLIGLARNGNEYEENQAEDYALQESLLSQILTFNKNCKKRKGKRKGGKHQSRDEQSEEEEKEIIQIHSVTPLQSQQAAGEVKKDVQSEEVVNQSIKPVAEGVRLESEDEQRNWSAERRGVMEGQLPIELQRFYQQQPQGNLEASALEDIYMRGSFQPYIQNMKESIKYPYPSINPTPTDFKSRLFNQEMIKNFAKELTLSRSSFTPSYFNSRQEGERTINFIQSIPNLSAETLGLLNSSQIRIEMEDSTNISEKLKRSLHTQSSFLPRNSQELKTSLPTYLPSSAKPSQRQDKE